MNKLIITIIWRPNIFKVAIIIRIVKMSNMNYLGS